jgi:hypothetical protein
MPTILPAGAILALILAGCSSSANPFTGPDVEPGRGQKPTGPCDLPKDPPGSGAHRIAFAMTSSCAR